MVTAATYRQDLLFLGKPRLDFLQATILEQLSLMNWNLQAWCVLPNHNHLIATSDDPASLAKTIRKIHSITARHINAEDNKPGRQVWFQYWDSHITFEKSYLARLNYVHQNAQYHGLIKNAENYSWCSTSWFAREATPAFYNTVMNFKTDKLKVKDIDCNNPNES